MTIRLNNDILPTVSMHVTESHSLSRSRHIRVSKRLFFLAVLLICLRAGGTAVPESDSGWESWVTRFHTSSDVGLFVQRAGTDTILLDFQGEKNRIPASTQKLVTTFIALEKLGAEKTFSTGLYRTGKIAGGVLEGDLIIQGGGDPAFGSSRMGKEQEARSIFTLWLKAMREAGIREIRGCVLADPSYLEVDGPNPAGLWEDIGNYYGGIASGLSFHDNAYHIHLSGSAKSGVPVRIKTTEPRYAGISEFVNKVRTGPVGSEDSAYIFGSPLSRIRLLLGTYPAGKPKFSIRGSLPNPPWTCAMELRALIAENGIRLRDSAACSDRAWIQLPEKGRRVKIAEHISPPLREIIRHTNQKSDNNFAEQLLAILGKEFGAKGNYRGGLAVMDEYLRRHGFNSGEYHFRDGSGLSRYNWVSPRQMCRLLNLAYRRPHFPVFKTSLLGSGDTGGNLKRFGMGKNKEMGWENRLWCKTGTLEGVFGLSGYLLPRSGRLICFTLIVNNFPGASASLNRSAGEILTEMYERF